MQPGLASQCQQDSEYTLSVLTGLHQPVGRGLHRCSSDLCGVRSSALDPDCLPQQIALVKHCLQVELW